MRMCAMHWFDRFLPAIHDTVKPSGKGTKALELLLELALGAPGKPPGGCCQRLTWTTGDCGRGGRRHMSIMFPLKFLVAGGGGGGPGRARSGCQVCANSSQVGGGAFGFASGAGGPLLPDCAGVGKGAEAGGALVGGPTYFFALLRL